MKKQSFIKIAKEKYLNAYIWQLDETLQKHFIKKLFIFLGCLLCCVVIGFCSLNLYITLFAFLLAILSCYPDYKFYRDICKGKIMVIDATCTKIYNVNTMKGISGKIKRTYVRNYFELKKDDMNFKIYVPKLNKDIAEGHNVRFYTNPDNAREEGKNNFIICDCPLYFKL